MASDPSIWYYSKNQFDIIPSLPFFNKYHLINFDLISKICKDKVETQVWFTCLNTLISPGQHGSQPQHTGDMRSAALSFDVNLCFNIAYFDASLFIAES
jgi:hypothetical protein